MVDQRKYTIHPDKYGERFQWEIEQRLRAREQEKKPTQYQRSEDAELLRSLIEKNRPVPSLDMTVGRGKAGSGSASREKDQNLVRHLGMMFARIFRSDK